MRTDGGAVADRDAAEDDAALAEEDPVADRDRTGAVDLVPVVAVVVGGADEDAVGDDAVRADGHRVERVQVDVVAEVGAVADAELAAAGLAGEPGALEDGAAGAEVDAFDTLELVGADDDRAGADAAEGPAVDEVRGDSPDAPAEAGARLGQPRA